MKKLFWMFLIVALVATAAVAQRRGRRGGFGGGFGGGWGGGESYVPDGAVTPREVQPHSFDETGAILEIPWWTNAPGFTKDVFTFARIRRNWKSNSGGTWATDTPDSDLNLSFRLQQVTSMKVDPEGRYLHLTDKELANYPFIYMVEPGTLSLDDDEVTVLRKYLLNGGFLWLDDFWGESEWQGMAEELKKVFPERDFVELPLDHPIYHCVFDIKSKGQIPAINIWETRRVTWERSDAHEVHHRAIFDDKGRLMVFATHNTDNGDGWEREGENHEYFEKFSEGIAYPLAVNVLFYVMTH